MNKRIWELDALRGLGLLLMIAVHITYDLTELFGLVRLTHDGLYLFCREWMGSFFLILSGVCVTLGSHPVKRGLTVFAAGLLITAVTVGMYLLGLADRDVIIYFGVLHCLGVCMVLWPLLKKLPTWTLPLFGAALIAVGLWLCSSPRGETALAVPLGIYPASFLTSDYFPLLPNLGYFLLGCFVGKTLYAGKTSRLPEKAGDFFLMRFFRFLGRHSLAVYLLHQPVIYGVIAVISEFTGR